MWLKVYSWSVVELHGHSRACALQQGKMLPQAPGTSSHCDHKGRVGQGQALLPTWSQRSLDHTCMSKGKGIFKLSSPDELGTLGSLETPSREGVCQWQNVL